MKRNRFWLLGAFVLVSALLIGAVHKRSQQPLYQLSRYSQTPAFKSYMFELSDEMITPISGVNSTLLSIDEPLAGDFETVLQYKISSDSQFDLNTLSYNTGRGGSGRTASTNAQQQATIHNLIDQLPSSAPPDKRENLLVVLFYKSKGEELRLYDSRNPPTQIRQIVGILTDIVKAEETRIPAEQRPTGAGLPHLRSPLRPSTARRAPN